MLVDVVQGSLINLAVVKMGPPERLLIGDNSSELFVESVAHWVSDAPRNS